MKIIKIFLLFSLMLWAKTTALIAIPKVGSTTLELIELVEQNKKLLHELQR